MSGQSFPKNFLKWLTADWFGDRAESASQSGARVPAAPAGPAAGASIGAVNRLELDPRSRQTLCALLGEYGRHAFNLAELDAIGVRAECERWVAHVEDGAPAPSRPAAQPGSRTEWDDLLRFFANHRRAEEHYVNSGMSGLRRGLWNMIDVVARELSAQRTANDGIQAQLQVLKTSVDRGSLEDLRHAVTFAVGAIGHTLSERDARHRVEIDGLGQQLLGMRSELERTRLELANDPLTRIYNRAALDNQLLRTRALCLIARRPASIILLDIDHFKAVNDERGHQAGDAVLCGLADTCVRVFPRKADFVARYGGEELCIVVEEELESAKRLAERLRVTIEKANFEYEGSKISVTASIGVAEFDDTEDLAHWVRRADEALYAAKQGGRNRVVAATAPAQPATASDDAIGETPRKRA